MYLVRQIHDISIKNIHNKIPHKKTLCPSRYSTRERVPYVGDGKTKVSRVRGDLTIFFVYKISDGRGIGV